MSTDTHPNHIRPISTDREDLVAYEIDGHITSDEIISVYTELLAAYKKMDKIDLMVKMTNFDGFDWGAVFSDTTYAAKTKSLSHIRRYAVVGGPAWIHTMAAVFNPFSSVEMKTFDLEDEEQAWAWLNEKSET